MGTMLRGSIALCCLALAGVWAGGAAAVGPVRTVTFEADFTFDNSPFCGDAVIAVHSVGRITDMTWSNADGTDLRFSEHYAAVTGTYTNLDTGATLTIIGSNLETDHLSLDPTTSGFTLTTTYSGLNFRVAGTARPPLVSGGRAVVALTGTYEVIGNVIYLSPVTETQNATPDMMHITQILCG